MLKQDDNGWMPCSKGALSSAVERVRTKRRQSSLIRKGVITFACALALFVASVYIPTRDVELECSQCVGLLVEYLAGDLDGETRRVLERHLVSCEKCRVKVNQMQADKKVLQTVSLLPSTSYQKVLLLSAVKSVPLSIDR